MDDKQYCFSPLTEFPFWQTGTGAHFLTKSISGVTSRVLVSSVISATLAILSTYSRHRCCPFPWVIRSQVASSACPSATGAKIRFRQGKMMLICATQSEQAVISSTSDPVFGSRREYHVLVTAGFPPFLTSVSSMLKFGQIPSLSLWILEVSPNKLRSGWPCWNSHM